MEKTYDHTPLNPTSYYLARAVSSPESDFGKAVVCDFVRILSEVCPGLCPSLYGKSTAWILMKFGTLFTGMV